MRTSTEPCIIAACTTETKDFTPSSSLRISRASYFLRYMYSRGKPSALLPEPTKLTPALSIWRLIRGTKANCFCLGSYFKYCVHAIYNMLYEVFLRVVNLVESGLKILSSSILVTCCCVLAVMGNQTQVEVWSLKLNAALGKL